MDRFVSGLQPNSVRQTRIRVRGNDCPSTTRTRSANTITNSTVFVDSGRTGARATERKGEQEKEEVSNISSDRLTRQGWQAQDLIDTRTMRDGVIDTWPHYLHMSVLFVSLPEGMQTARQLKEMLRGNGRLRDFFEGLREVLQEGL